ncbi:MAG: hypothetical protein QGF09_03805 [Rhodospirillales bacterium]|nr:hypothetical protein [Rhodospirillales bacterium]
MDLTDILVHVGGDDQGSGRIEIAANLATAHGAHLSGLFVRPAPYLALYDLSDFPTEILETQVEEWRQIEKKVENFFPRPPRRLAFPMNGFAGKAILSM